MFLEKFFYSFIMSLPVVITTIGILIFLFIKFKKTRTLILSPGSNIIAIEGAIISNITFDFRYPYK